MKRDIRILLHDIRSVHNVGAIFRTADAVGVTKIYLSGYTPAPVDRFGLVRTDFAKASLGSEKTIAWEIVENSADSITGLISDLKKDSFEIISVEQDARSVDYKDAQVGEKALVIFGNEVSGVLKDFLDASDIITEIPMRGMKESLNISVSAGIVLFRWFDK